QHDAAQVAKPWQVTPLRAMPPPTSDGPPRTPVAFVAPSERAMARPEQPSISERRGDARPLSPPVPETSSSSRHLPAEPEGPAVSQENVRTTQPARQSAARTTTPMVGDLPRERVASQFAEPSRQMPETSADLLA